jgi:hypothetical protein
LLIHYIFNKNNDFLPFLWSNSESRVEEALKGLRKLIEIAIVELIGWTKGTFTLDKEDIAVSPECSYPIGKMEQATGLDAQMVLMDALRIFDERERNRQSGKNVPPYIPHHVGTFDGLNLPASRFSALLHFRTCLLLRFIADFRMRFLILTREQDCRLI